MEQCYYGLHKDGVLGTNSRELVVFDLDGTLVDSEHQISVATNETRRLFGLSPAKSRQLQSWFGKHPKNFFPELSAEDNELAVNSFRNTLSESLHLIKPIRGAHNLLDYLKEMNATLAVATTKPSWLAVSVVGEVGMSTYFDHIQGSEGLNPKPSTDVFKKVEETLGFSPKLKFAIGDRISDMKASVGSGYRSTLLSSWFRELNDREFSIMLARKYKRVGSLAEYQVDLSRQLSRMARD
jgi:phosphoglycolate phosphatase